MASKSPAFSAQAKSTAEMATKVETNSVSGLKQTQTPAASANPASAVADGESKQAVNLTGRAVFSVETTAAGVVVRTAFLTEDKRLLDMPAVFPDMLYAMNVIDDLRRQVMQHFSQAVQVGTQVIANQARNQQKPAPDVVGTKNEQYTTIKG
jgi:hypothetical protein